MGERHPQYGFWDQLQRSSLAVPPATASVWFHGETPRQFEAAGEVISGLVADRPQIRLVLTSASPATVVFLRHWLPGEQAGPLPWALMMRRFIRTVNPRLLVLLDGGRSFGWKGVHEALRAGVQVAVVEKPALDDAFEAASPDSLTFFGSDETPESMLRSLRPLVPSLPHLSADEAWLKGTVRDRIGQSQLWRSASRWWTTRRIDDWEGLRERLGRPRAVLCLGNGPSSKDPRLATQTHDCLMRVNWQWRNQGLLTRPQVVFVGDAATIHKTPPCLYGFWNRSIESAMLLRHLVTRGPGRMEYITLERLSPLIGGRTWPARPTNGALMIVTAAGLAPELLIISGMDLFQHPEGRYPWDRLSRNEYARAHSRQVELALIDLALCDYQGEVVILSDILRESLARYREATRVRTR